MYNTVISYSYNLFYVTVVNLLEQLLGLGEGAPPRYLLNHLRFFYDFWQVVRLRYKEHSGQKIFSKLSTVFYFFYLYIFFKFFFIYIFFLARGNPALHKLQSQNLVKLNRNLHLEYK